MSGKVTINMNAGEDFKKAIRTCEADIEALKKDEKDTEQMATELNAPKFFEAAELSKTERATLIKSYEEMLEALNDAKKEQDDTEDNL